MTQNTTEKIAKLFALEYYTGCLFAQYESYRYILNIAGPEIADNPELKQKWIEERVEEHVNMFWRHFVHRVEETAAILKNEKMVRK